MRANFYQSFLKFWRQKVVWATLSLSLATRTLWLAAAALGVRCSKPSPQEGADAVETLRHLPSPLVAMWAQWSALFVYDSASVGYGGLAKECALRLFPVFSPLVRASATALHLPPPVAGLVVANLSDCVGWVLVALWLRRRLPTEQALWAMFAFALFPLRDFGFTAYSEGLFLSLSMAAFLAFDTKRWVLAILFSALVAAVRPQGVFVGLALGLSSLFRIFPAPLKTEIYRKAVLLWLACPLGLVASVGALLHHQGRLDVLLHVLQSAPSRRVLQHWPRATGHAASPQDYGAMALTAAALLKILRRRSRPQDWLYLLFSMGFPLASGQMGSWGRHCGVLPPIFAEVGLSLRGRRKKAVCLALAAFACVVVAFRTGQGASVS